MNARLKEQNTQLPPAFHSSYEACFTAHDIAVQMLKSGMEQRIFDIPIDNEYLRAHEVPVEDISTWLDSIADKSKIPDLLISRMFPAILSDMLHYVFEALEASRKGKLAVAYTLLRKPLQDNLFVLEAIVDDRDSFAEKFSYSPPKLDHGKNGGLDGHRARIQRVLDKVGKADAFNADFLTQLRYDKSNSDSFDGFCNKATHLFTTKTAIVTKPYQANFIFSSYRDTVSQWSYLYSRLPYVLLYCISILEHISGRFALTPADYSNDMDRRLSAGYILSLTTVSDEFKSDHLYALAESKLGWLYKHCEESEFPFDDTESIDIEALIRMAETGAFPGEPEERVQIRDTFYRELSEALKAEYEKLA